MKKIICMVLMLSLLLSGVPAGSAVFAAEGTTETGAAVSAEDEAEDIEEEEEDYEDEEEEEESETIGPEDVVVNDVPSGSGSIVNSNRELRGIWVPFCDFYARGLFNKTESEFRKNVRAIVNKAAEYKCNVIFFHVRSHDDAMWKSKTFNASPYLVPSNQAKKLAVNAYSFDPLQIFIEEAHAQNIELHAYMNPYRVVVGKFYDPSKKSSRDRVLKAVDEVLKYDVDGIHFDDYFYNSTGYVTVENKTTVKKLNPAPALKRKYVNALVSAVYTRAHKAGKVFGIAPQGNYENDMNGGADVKTWLSKKGYVDYVMPQIYWSDQWSSNGSVTMFTDRMNLFKKLQTNKSIKLYAGLALYNGGKSLAGDIGWKKKNNNIALQVKKLRAAGLSGYSLYTISSMYTTPSQKECKNLLKYLKKTTK